MSVKKYPNKKDVKFFRTPAGIESGVSDGNLDLPLKEDIPEYLARCSDHIIKPEQDNNTMIVMGRDRFFLEKIRKVVSGNSVEMSREEDHIDPAKKTLVSGYSNHQGAGAIDIVVGRGAPYPIKSAGSKLGPLFTSLDQSASSKIQNEYLNDGNSQSSHPGLFMDAARIYTDSYTHLTLPTILLV